MVGMPQGKAQCAPQTLMLTPFINTWMQSQVMHEHLHFKVYMHACNILTPNTHTHTHTRTHTQEKHMHCSALQGDEQALAVIGR